MTYDLTIFIGKKISIQQVTGQCDIPVMTGFKTFFKLSTSMTNQLSLPDLLCF